MRVSIDPESGLKVKTCPRCKLSLTLDHFYGTEEKPSCYCRKCQQLYNSEWRKNNKKHFNKLCKTNHLTRRERNREQGLESCKQSQRKRKSLIQERRFLYGGQNNISLGGLLVGDGCCMICGESDPLTLVAHHLFGKEHDDFITVCGSCHTALHRCSESVLMRLERN